MKIITGHGKIMGLNMFYLTSHNYEYDFNHVSIIKVNVNIVSVSKIMFTF